MKIRQYILLIAVWLLSLPILPACSSQDEPDSGSAVPEDRVEVRPVLPGVFSSIPRTSADAEQPASRTYDPNDVTNGKLNNSVRLAEGSTVWLIAKKDGTSNALVKNSYVVYNPADNEDMTYLVPCTVNDDGSIKDMEGSPLFLKDGTKYRFYVVSPARKLDEDKLSEGQVALQLHNGEYLCANDCRYTATTPGEFVTITKTNDEAVQVIRLNPMINQTAELSFRIERGQGVHDLDIQPSGIQISGLQDDNRGIGWHMSLSKNDEPIELKHGDKAGIYNDYDYEIDAEGRVNIKVPVIPMYSISKPVIVIFRLKVNGVPSSFEMMLNEKDFKAGYSYGYSGKVSINSGIEVITWQYVSWETNVEIPDPEQQSEQ